MAVADGLNWRSAGGLPVTGGSLAAVAVVPVLLSFVPTAVWELGNIAPIESPGGTLVVFTVSTFFLTSVQVLLSAILAVALWYDAGRIRQTVDDESADAWKPTRAYALIGVVHALGPFALLPYVVSSSALVYYLFRRRSRQRELTTL